MVMPMILRLVDLKVGSLYLVAVCECNVSLSFQATLVDIHQPVLYLQPWVLHFEGGITLQLHDDRRSSFLEVLAV